MREDQLFPLISLVAILLFIAGGALPLTPQQRRITRIGAVAVLAVGIGAALVLLVVG